MFFSRCWKQTLYALLLCAAGVSDATAGVLTLQWDPSPDRSVAGYTVYVGTESGKYSTTFDVGNQLRFTFQDAKPGRSYYFAVAAYTSGNVFGPLSVEVSGRVDASLVLMNPGDVTTVAGVPATVQLRASASSGVLAYAATGLPYGVAVDAATGLISGTPAIEGTHHVTATVSTGLNVASESFAWTVTRPKSDTPAVVVTLPTSSSSFTTSKRSVLLGGVAAADQGINSVEWTNNRGGSGRATGTDRWMAAVPLQSGRNEITITAVDGSSNRSSIRVVVYRAATFRPSLPLGPRVE